MSGSSDPAGTYRSDDVTAPRRRRTVGAAIAILAVWASPSVLLLGLTSEPLPSLLALAVLAPVIVPWCAYALWCVLGWRASLSGAECLLVHPFHGTRRIPWTAMREARVVGTDVELEWTETAGVRRARLRVGATEEMRLVIETVSIRMREAATSADAPPARATYRDPG